MGCWLNNVTYYQCSGLIFLINASTFYIYLTTCPFFQKKCIAFYAVGVIVAVFSMFEGFIMVNIGWSLGRVKKLTAEGLTSGNMKISTRRYGACVRKFTKYSRCLFPFVGFLIFACLATTFSNGVCPRVKSDANVLASVGVVVADGSTECLGGSVVTPEGGTSSCCPSGWDPNSDPTLSQCTAITQTPVDGTPDDSCTSPLNRPAEPSNFALWGFVYWCAICCLGCAAQKQKKTYPFLYDPKPETVMDSKCLICVPCLNLVKLCHP